MSSNGGELSSIVSSLSPINETVNNGSDILVTTTAVHIAFYIGEVISISCIIFGILGNTGLIVAIYRSSFYRFPFGLLLLFIAIFDIVRLISAAIYYLIQAYIIPLNVATMTAYVVLYRYPKNVTNWLKVFLAVERIIAIKNAIANRYNVNSMNSTKIERSKQKRTLYLICLLLICSLISQHPNFIPNRYLSPLIDPNRLLFIFTPNPNFYYGRNVYNSFLFTIISYIILDDAMPIVTLIIFNTILLYKLQHLPLITREKIAASIWILFFLTILAIFVVPHSFIVYFNLYVDREKVNDTIIAIVFHTCQGLEMMNHAITGYACFLSSQQLRKGLIESIHMICKKLQTKPRMKNNLSMSCAIELPAITIERI